MDSKPLKSRGARIVPAVDRAARILALIESRAKPMSITELAEHLGASKGAVREILETLRFHGLLERNAESKRYRLGPQLARLGTASSNGESLQVLARPHLAALSDELRENVLLLTIQPENLLIQDAFEPRDPKAMILVSATRGHAIPMNAGACGKIVQLWGNDACRQLASQASPAGKVVTGAELKRTRSRGYAIDDQEFLEGVRGVAAPILGPAERLAALILVSGLAASLTLDRLEAVGARTRAAADAISRLLGDTRLSHTP